MRRVTDDERRRRLVARHHLGGTATSAVQATRDLVALHSSDPLTPPLALHARLDGGDGVAAFEQAAYDDRTLWRLHAMRSTLWVVAVQDAPMVAAAATRKVHDTARRRVARWLTEDGIAGPEAHLERLGGEVRALLGDGGQRATTEVTAAVDGLTDRTRGGATSVGSKVLWLEAAAGRIVRTAPAGGWTSSQYAWSSTDAWFGEGTRARLAAPSVEAAQVALARRYLDRFGPATFADVQWWTGWTKTATRRALAALDPLEVALDGGGTGLLASDDPGVTVSTTDEPVVTLLPGLDPSVMGWKQRGWLTSDREDWLFDRNGNAGPTVLVDGEVVGGWATDPDGVVRHDATVAADRVDASAAALTAFLDDRALKPRFPTPSSRALSQT